MVFIPLQRSILKIRQEVTERDINPADIPFGKQLCYSADNKHEDLGNDSFSTENSSFSSGSSTYSRTDSTVSESDSCFSEEEEVDEDGRDSELFAYRLPYRRYTESITLAQRPPYQRRHYGMEWVIENKRRFREEVRLQLGAKPATVYSTTVQCFINSKFRRYRDAVYVVPGAPSPKSFTTTVYLLPKLPRKNIVSSLEHHTAKTIKWYKVSVELEARDYVSVKLVQLS